MIVCSCNVLSAKAIKGCLAPGPGCPRTPAQVYQCLGCRPECGRCAVTIRKIMEDALIAALAPALAPCALGCCPAGEARSAGTPEAAGTGAVPAA